MSIAQPLTSSPSDLVREADKQLRLGNPDSAKDLYESALRVDGNSITARIGLGKAAIQEQKWSDGCDIFENVLNRDTANLFAHYGAGICHREYGLQLGWPLRTMQWRKATDHLLLVIARDSTFEDVLYQLAILFEYKKEYLRSIALGHRQAELRPDMNEARLGLLRLYRYYIAVQDPKEVMDSLAHMHSDHARFFEGEILRRQGNLDAAEQVFVSLLSTPRQISSEAISLSLARVYFEKGQTARAEEIYWHAVDRISSWLGAALVFEDIKYLVTDAELGTYRAVLSDGKKKAFFHSFWNLRNPTPAAKTNARLAEHYRRLLFAEHNYEYYESRSWFNDPDKMHYLRFPKSFALNREFNDKGLIFVRHGEPNDIQRTIGAGERDQYESWLYSATGDSPKRIFHFAQSNSVGNNWRLTSMPDDPEMLEHLEMWDNRYHRLVNGQELDQRMLLEQLRGESQVTLDAALATDEHRWTTKTKTFAVPHSIDAFRGDNGKALLNISYALPIASLINELSDTLKTLQIELGISVSRPNGEKVASGLDTLSFVLSPHGWDWFVEMYRFVLRADSVRIAMHARPVGMDIISTWDKQLRIPAYPPPTPLLSNIEFLLPATTKSSIDIDGVKVIPSPFDALPRSEPVYVYWEAYNLTKDFGGSTRFKSQVLLTPGTSGPNDETVVAYEKDHTGQDEFTSEFARLDVRKFDKGIYTVTVQITDRMIDYTFSTSRSVTLTGN
jgi:GWxTD domain-containing protein